MNIEKIGTLPESYKSNALTAAKQVNTNDNKNINLKNKLDTVEFAKNSPAKSFGAELTEAKEKVTKSLKQDAPSELIADFQQRIQSGQYRVSSMAIVDRMFSV